MYAVRLETSPAAGSSTKVVITNWPLGKSESGPRSIGWNFWPSNAEATSKPTGGTVTTPPISAPSPSVEASRNLLRAKRSPGAGGGAPAGPTFAGGAGPATAGSGGGGGGSCVLRPERSRTQRKPKTSAIAPPTATAGQLTIRPTRTHATPTAKPTGQTVGGGRWGLSCSGVTRLHYYSFGRLADAVLAPPPFDLFLDRIGHHDLRRPLAGAFLGQLVGRVDADLAADELVLGR